MEILYYLSAICLILFMLIATYDGLYLHIWKFELFKKKESVFEHKIHTIRAILFPLIIWLLFINTNQISFGFGIALIVIDLIVLGVDAYSETDSRKSVGGLPKWEYILHLFANGFHFAAILLFLGTKIIVTETGLILNHIISASFATKLFGIIASNIIPGAVMLAALHLILIFPKGILFWNKYRTKIKCC